MTFSITQPRNKISAFLILLLVALWIHVHSYRGIWHDGKLYLGQALFRLFPGIYGQDIFFKFGSQDQFTLFSPVYAWVIGHVGIGNGAMGMEILAQSLFLIGLVWCCISMYGRYTGLWAAIAVAIVPRNYGGLDVFSYSETFVTARSFAEPLCLLAIGAALNRKPYLALSILLLALLVHPLIALPCLMLWWFFMITQDRRWIWLILSLPVLPLLGYLGVAPFNELLQTYDDQWWASVRDITRQVIPLKWTSANWAYVAYDGALIWFAARFVDRRLRSFLLALLASAAVCIAISIVGTSGLRNVLITALQIWRAHWILHLIAVTTIPLIVLAMWPLGGLPRFGAMLIVASAYLLPYPGALGAVLLAIFLYRYHLSGGALSREMKIALFAALIAMVFLKSGGKLMGIVGRDAILSDVNSIAWNRKALQIVFAFPVYFVVAIGFGWLAGQPRFRWAAHAGVIALLVIGLVTWDRREPWERYLERDHPEPHPFQQYVEKGGEVYWYGDLLAPWILLKAPSYFEADQGGGVSFNRQTAAVYANRAKALTVLHFQTELCEITDFLNKKQECQPSADVVREACKTSPTLSVMVLPWKVSDIQRREWSPRLPGDDRQRHYYLYECSQFKK